jgi:hypothetical protein
MESQMYQQIITPDPSTIVVLRDARGRAVGVVVSPSKGPDLGPGGRTVLLSRVERGQEQQ